jgi:hypothetical protein
MVELSIDEDKKLFILSGEVELIFRNRRVKYYFLDILKAIFLPDNLINIPFVESEKESVLQKIQEALIKYGISQTDSDQIKTA